MKGTDELYPGDIVRVLDTGCFIINPEVLDSIGKPVVGGTYTVEAIGFDDVSIIVDSFSWTSQKLQQVGDDVGYFLLTSGHFGYCPTTCEDEERNTYFELLESTNVEELEI